MARKTVKKVTEGPEAKLDRWLADPSRKMISQDRLENLGWQAGQGGFVEVRRFGLILNYERFNLPEGDFCVVEWDTDGNVVVL